MCTCVVGGGGGGGGGGDVYIILSPHAVNKYNNVSMEGAAAAEFFLASIDSAGPPYTYSSFRSPDNNFYCFIEGPSSRGKSSGAYLYLYLYIQIFSCVYHLIRVIVLFFFPFNAQYV